MTEGKLSYKQLVEEWFAKLLLLHSPYMAVPPPPNTRHFCRHFNELWDKSNVAWYFTRQTSNKSVATTGM